MRSRELIIVAVTAVLLVLTGIASSLALDHERERAERAADARAGQAAAAVGYAIGSSVDRLEGLRDLFASSSNAVTESEFERFGRGLLEDRTLYTVSFTTLVRQADRAVYETRRGFPVLDPSGRRAGTRAVYYPVTFVAGLEPFVGIGVDVGLDPARSKALTAAAAANAARATGIVTLRTGVQGFVVYLPVRDVRREVTGFVGATFERDRLLQAVAPALPRQANVRLWDAAATAPELGDRDRVRTIAVAGRTWRVAVAAPALPELAFPVGLAVSGFLLTILVAIVLLEMRRQAAGAIRKSDETETQFRLLAENSTDVIARQTADGTLFYVSPAARSVIGYDPEELVGQQWQSLAHPDDLDDDGLPVNVVVEAPDVHTYTLRLRRSDGQWVWVETTVRRLRDAETGELEEVQAATRDITARMMAEERVRRSEAFFRSAFEGALVPMCLTAPDGAVLRVNQRLCDLLGRTERELVGSSFASLTHPDDAGLSVDEVRGALVGDSEGIRMEKRYLHADGSIVWVELTSSLVRDGFGRPLYFVTQMVDISDRRRAEEALENALASEREQVEALRELHRLQDEFVSVVSHELRTPLTSIDGYIELALEEGESVDPEVRGFLETAHRNSARLRRLVEDLLVLHRADAGKLAVGHAEVDLERVVLEAAGAVAPAAARQGVEVVVESCEQPLPVVGDPDRLGQVLDNLLSNAVKFTPGGGRVRVQLTSEDGSARIAVSDTGIGIPAAELGRLSERFFRTSNATAHAIQGTGLGLAITKTMVEMHGGSLSVESEEGRGSTFAVTLPLAA